MGKLPASFKPCRVSPYLLVQSLYLIFFMKAELPARRTKKLLRDLSSQLYMKGDGDWTADRCQPTAGRL